MLPDRIAAACQGGDLLPQVVSALTRHTSPKFIVQCGRPSLSLATKMQEFGGNSTPCEEFRWFWRIIPSFLPFFLRLQRSGQRKPGKCEVRNYNSAELRNQWSYKASKQFHFLEATSNRRIGSLLWHLRDNKRFKQPKKLPPITVFCESSIKNDTEINILTGSPHQVGKLGKSRKYGSGSRTRENEVLKTFTFLRPKIYKLPRPSR